MCRHPERRVRGHDASDHLLLGAGSDVYYMLSEWYPVYNVGEWHFTVNRNTSCSLTP